MELNFEGVGISQMPMDRLAQSFHEMIKEYEKRGLNTLDYLPLSLTLPPDAAVREAVDVLREDYEMYCPQPDHDPPKNYYARVRWWAVVTIIRAVQAPRLTPEQVEAVKMAETLLTDTMSDYGDCEHDVGHCICKYHSGVLGLRSAFPDAFEGEVER